MVDASVTDLGEMEMDGEDKTPPVRKFQEMDISQD
jgi:hypothetical protein